MVQFDDFEALETLRRPEYNLTKAREIIGEIAKKLQNEEELDYFERKFLASALERISMGELPTRAFRFDKNFEQTRKFEKYDFATQDLHKKSKNLGFTTALNEVSKQYGIGEETLKKRYYINKYIYDLIDGSDFSTGLPKLKKPSK